jgi:Uma2 family endonuclease
LKTQLGGEVLVECAIATPTGLFVPDVVWASRTFMDSYSAESPLMRAPEICIEVLSPSNSRKEMTEKREAYFAVGAQEVWFVYQHARRCEFYGAAGLVPDSGFAVDLSEIFA